MSPMTGERAIEGNATRTAGQALERLLRTAQPDSVFGHAVERGEVTIIPCCEFMLGMGMGSGSGTSPAQGDATESRRPTSAGEGAGAGGGAQGRPVAAIVITGNQVRVEPIVDATKVALAALTTAGFMAFWLARLASSTRRQPTGVPAVVPTSPAFARLIRLRRR